MRCTLKTTSAKSRAPCSIFSSANSILHTLVRTNFTHKKRPKMRFLWAKQFLQAITNPEQNLKNRK
ncbi:hypothetical protein O59_003070 [Cellvibrio sp. BR]|nr:hypothetical protein O59_003070 [Cellvibrio sp. BR]